MNNSFEYLDIILLAMIAGFIILRLRGMLGRRTGHERKILNDTFSKEKKSNLNQEKVVNLGSANLDEAAKNFYDYLHVLDNSKCRGIAVAPIPNYKLGKTINDRLKRATKK